MAPRPRFVPRGSWGEVCADHDACRDLPNRADLRRALLDGRIDDVRAAGLREVESGSVWVTWCTQHRALTMPQWACEVSSLLLDAGAPPLRRRRRRWPEHPIVVGVRRVDAPASVFPLGDRYLPDQQWQTCDAESAEIVATVSGESTIAAISLEIAAQLEQVYERVWGARP